jgi:EAL domain-containing protein (putative c-di-GMP-specific phosphodiesterase class I)
MEPMADGERPQISIDEALANGWIVLWYQPKVDLKQKCLAGAEALVRIRHPVYGDLAPGSFAPIVDETGIAHLTHYALISALTNWSQFEQAGFHLHLSLNVPGRLLGALPLSNIVDEYRPQSDRWPGIVLEVTEVEVAQNLGVVKHMAEDWRSRGITIAVDDVGADTSFECMRELPFGELKIDRRIVKDCTVDSTNAGICQTIVDLAHRFGGAAVASGVDTQADLRALMAMDCDFGQGPVIAPAMSQEHLLEMLLQRVDRQSAPVPAISDRRSDTAGAVGRVA